MRSIHAPKGAYFWLMVCLYVLLALGALLWAVGVATGAPPAFPPPGLPA